MTKQKKIMLKQKSLFYLSTLLLAIAPSSNSLCMQKLMSKFLLQTQKSLPQPRNSMFGKIMDSFGKSEFMEHYNDYLASQYPINIPLASEAMQQLGQKAQLTVGVKENRLVPIRDFREIPKGQFSAGYKNIFLSEDYCSKIFFTKETNGLNRNKTASAYGILNHSLLHEGSHIKHNDAATMDWIRETTFYSSLFLTPVLTKLAIDPRMLSTYFLATFITTTIGDKLAKKQLKHCERRADIEAFYAAKCHNCVAEIAAMRHEMFAEYYQEIRLWQPVIDNPSRYEQASQDEAPAIVKEFKDKIAFLSRYSAPEEGDAIATHLKKENKLCDYHRAEQETSPNALTHSTK